MAFLPRAPLEKPFKIILFPSPTPLPAFSIKKIDAAKKTGEFVITYPTPQSESSSYEKQVVIDGVYEVSTKKISISPSVKTSNASIREFPQVFDDAESILLRFEMISNNELAYRVNLPLANKTNVIPFKIILPFSSDLKLNIYDRDKTLLLSQTIKL